MQSCYSPCVDDDRPSIREIRAFLEVERARNFSAAARALRVSQPALSRTIAALERHLGHRLFERTGRRLDLTTEGHAFLEVATVISSTHATELRRFDRYCGGSAGTVTIAAIPSVTAVVLPAIISSFSARYPDVTVKMIDGPDEANVQLLLAAKADVAISLLWDRREGLARHPLIGDDFQLTCRPDHELAAVAQVSWADAAEHAITSLPDDSSVRQLASATFSRLGLVPHTVFEVATIPALGGIVAAGLGVATVPSLVLPLIDFAGVHSQLLEEPVVERRLGLMYPSDRPLTGPARLLLDHIACTDDRPDIPAGTRWLDR